MSAGRRTAGDVYIVGASAANPVSIEKGRRVTNLTAVDATTSAGVIIISVNCTGCESFAITNSGSVNIYIEGSYNGTFFHPSVAVVKMVDNVSVNSISASTAARFDGPFCAIRVVAQSASGIYRAALQYR